MAGNRGDNGPSGSGTFTFPSWFAYPPSFTVQPVEDTFSKQSALWSSLILSYCAHHRVHVIDIFEEDFELFRNRAIDRHLNVGERRVFLDALQRDHNKGRWVSGVNTRDKSFFLVLWRPLEDSVLEWVEAQMEDVVLLDDVVDGLGLGRWAWGQEVVREALEAVERGGRVKTFTQRSNGRKHIGIKLLQ